MENIILARKGESWLTWFLRGLLVLSITILLARLIELQIIKGGYYRSLAEGNRLRRVPIVAPRGLIKARGGENLASNLEVYKRIVFNPEVGFEKKDAIGNEGDNLITEWQRYYDSGAVAAHITGYLGEVNQEESGKIDPRCSEKGPRRIGSLIGRSGLEEEYDCKLRGEDGEELIEVDTQGTKVRTLGKKDPIPGEDIATTVDYWLQKKVSTLMDEKKGAILVTDSNGEILALYSSPSFDPNILIRAEKEKEIQDILTDSSLPIFNRSISGTYHPGSVFKIVTATAALEEGKISSSYLYDDQGVINIGKFSYSNWYFDQYGKTEGTINLVKAIARSTDTFFYKVGEIIGPQKLAEWANKFGIGQKSGIDLPGEVAGLVPTPQWKEEAKGEKWFLGNTYHMAIGQGDLAVTPLEIARETLVIASGGFLCKPGLVQETECKDINIGKETIQEIKDGMIAACQKGGTAYVFFDMEANKRVACKTGTAQTSKNDKTHAWFVAFGPSDQPEIVTTVLVEEGGEGSSVAAPIAKDIFDYYFLTHIDE